MYIRTCVYMGSITVHTYMYVHACIWAQSLCIRICMYMRVYGLDHCAYVYVRT